MENIKDIDKNLSIFSKFQYFLHFIKKFEFLIKDQQKIYKSFLWITITYFTKEIMEIK